MFVFCIVFALMVVGSSVTTFGSASAAVASDSDRFDPAYPEMAAWAEAGVEGDGIPTLTDVAVTVAPGENIQAAIDGASRRGGGVVLLARGKHQIRSQLVLKSNVVLRGESRRGTRLVVTMRSSGNDEHAIVTERGATMAGVENLTFFYRVRGFEPVERDGRFFKQFKAQWENNIVERRGSSTEISQRNDLHVGFVEFTQETENSWIRDAILVDAGTNPVKVDRRASHITIQNNAIDGCYNKGGGGNCYLAINGDSVLMIGNTVKEIRHVAIQIGAEHTVVVDNNLEVDVNFHNGDDGSNLVEGNRFRMPAKHHWEAISTGGRGIHQPAGPNNVVWNNDVEHGRHGRHFAGSDKVYTARGFSVSKLDRRPPTVATLFVGNR